MNNKCPNCQMVSHEIAPNPIYCYCEGCGSYFLNCFKNQSTKTEERGDVDVVFFVLPILFLILFVFLFIRSFF